MSALVGFRGGVRLLVLTAIVATMAACARKTEPEMEAARLPAPTVETVSIGRDMGGRLESYFAKADRAVADGTNMRVAGVCASACTLFLILQPLGRICAEPGAEFWFHAARGERSGLRNEVFTTRMRAYYPAAINQRLDAAGGLSVDQVVKIPGTDILPRCPTRTMASSRDQYIGEKLVSPAMLERHLR